MPSARFFHKDPKAPTSNRPIGVGVLALIESDGKLLMELRSDCERWGLPGGAVEPDEAIEDAIRREVFEESGLTVTGWWFLFGVFTDPTRIVAYPDGNSCVSSPSCIAWRSRISMLSERARSRSNSVSSTRIPSVGSTSWRQRDP